LFLELWDSAQVLTAEALRKFTVAHAALKRSGPDPDIEIEKAVGKAEPRNVDVGSWTQTRQRLFLKELQSQVYEQYRPAFREVTKILQEHQFRRPELSNVGAENETNRFLNWVRLTYVIGDDAWRAAPLRNQHERQHVIVGFGKEWTVTASNKIPEDYIAWLEVVQRTFGTKAALASASKQQLTDGLLSLHAFAEQQRFVKGGLKNLPEAFWGANKEVERVKKTLTYLLHGSGDFIERLHDVLYDADMKLGYFGRFCALELYGTVKPQECPPLNGRMAKALRYLGFNVRGG
jgi:hypothetical protein